MKLIVHHKIWMEDAKLPDAGICNSVPEEYLETLKLFKPSKKEDLKLKKEGKSVIFWASGVVDVPKYFEAIAYTPLRQTIVLLICAMHNEI